jgi:ribosome-associated protein
MEKGRVDIDEIEISDEPIALYKLLKLANLVPSGGEAKYVITEGLVTVNGAVEMQKGKKVFSGDVVEFQGTRIQVVSG